MKNIMYIVAILFINLVMMDNVKATIPFCEDPYCDPVEDFLISKNGQSAFRRTYIHQNSFVQKKKFIEAQTRSGNSPVITKADFESHMALGINRRLTIIPIGSAVTMDVKGTDETGDQPQVWDMPDFNSYLPVERNIQHITPESSGYIDEYPETTHSLYQPTDGIYRMFELTDDDLFSLGLINEDENGDADIWDQFYTLTPVPLEWGVDFEGIVIVEYTEDLEVDSTIVITRTEVVSYGTLNTYDDGPVQALKLHVNLSLMDYKDGQIIDESDKDHIVWYSEKGHYLLGVVEPGSPMTGEVSLTHMQYQRISESVSVNSVNTGSASLSFFPNPVSAGEVLTITNEMDIHYGLVQLFDIQGRLIRQIDLSGMGAVRNFQVQLPSDLMTGMYTFRVQTPSGEPIGHGKLNIH